MACIRNVLAETETWVCQPSSRLISIKLADAGLDRVGLFEENHKLGKADPPDAVAAFDDVFGRIAMLARRKMRSKELAERAGITEQNISLLKSGKVKRAIRYTRTHVRGLELPTWRHPGISADKRCRARGIDLREAADMTLGPFFRIRCAERKRARFRMSETGVGTASVHSRALVWIAASVGILGLLHHADHVFRGNHSGWPFSADVTPFTFSLLIYPILIYGIWRTWRRQASPRSDRQFATRPEVARSEGLAPDECQPPNHQFLTDDPPR
jgi:hypothetical protein